VSRAKIASVLSRENHLETAEHTYSRYVLLSVALRNSNKDSRFLGSGLSRREYTRSPCSSPSSIWNTKPGWDASAAAGVLILGARAGDTRRGTGVGRPTGGSAATAP
jgi:hypothetical protein